MFKKYITKYHNEEKKKKKSKEVIIKFLHPFNLNMDGITFTASNIKKYITDDNKINFKKYKVIVEGLSIDRLITADDFQWDIFTNYFCENLFYIFSLKVNGYGINDVFDIYNKSPLSKTDILYGYNIDEGYFLFKTCTDDYRDYTNDFYRFFKIIRNYNFSIKIDMDSNVLVSSLLFSKNFIKSFYINKDEYNTFFNSVITKVSKLKLESDSQKEVFFNRLIFRNTNAVKFCVFLLRLKDIYHYPYAEILEKFLHEGGMCESDIKDTDFYLNILNMYIHDFNFRKTVEVLYRVIGIKQQSDFFHGGKALFKCGYIF